MHVSNPPGLGADLAGRDERERDHRLVHGRDGRAGAVRANLPQRVGPRSDICN